MPDLKLFRLSPTGPTELTAKAAQVEKSLQVLFEANLEGLLGVRFLASEYSTGKVHGGRIDTLGLDENGCPVIIEYKRALNENVINQGLFYLEWLLDHRKEFQWLVMEKLGADAAKAVDWSGPRLLCIAGDFTRYDEHAVKQINRNIELIRYRHYGDDLLLLELVNATQAALPSPAAAAGTVAPTPTETAPGAAGAGAARSIAYRIAKLSPPAADLYEAVRTHLLALGDDVQVKELMYYIAFKRLRNFCCLEAFPSHGTTVLYLKLNPDSVALEPGFTRDVRAVGHYGTGDVEVTLSSLDDLRKAEPLIQRAYEGG
ncbi:DUF5655 domain-containing protein [Niveispirillum sp. BGYR6]|uniref:DUF5655 domain-containing protein n=1 Tax=Niveispirillum sp. BGYR6 TaxID=2971249 RepID=UPI0022B9715B|nr:DUF5655 domain-containing protein [Niveispirillum sp. BGYR6]MDG5498030.1 DUF5655 domain-containing protein [Niveispirillum sp. BGYR6]